MRADRHARRVQQANGNCVPTQGWEAELVLGFSHNGKKTVLADRRHRGPLVVQRPFYPEGGMCHLYLLHPPGGVVAGDTLSIDVHAEKGAEALLTTPAAGKFYRSLGPRARQNVTLNIESDAVVEWLPQETIIFEGAQIASETCVNLAQHARFIGWEITVLGRPACNERFSSGEAILDWRIFHDGRPLYLEKMRLDADMLDARWGLNGHSAFGTLFARPAASAHLAAIKTLIVNTPERAVTLIDDLLICRASDDNAGAVRRFFEHVRALVRKDVIMREDFAPRIWAT